MCRFLNILIFIPSRKFTSSIINMTVVLCCAHLYSAVPTRCIRLNRAEKHVLQESILYTNLRLRPYNSIVSMNYFYVKVPIISCIMQVPTYVITAISLVGK